MPDGNGLDGLPGLLARRPGLPVIVVSAQNTLSTAVRATEAGAFDYLPKPFDLDELTGAVASALAGDPVDDGRGQLADGMPLIGRSPAMQDVYRTIARVVPTMLTVLILGESGTGKELVARAIHDLGPRRRAPFVAVNMAAIPRELIESELFGHERGAFTGAAGPRVGPLRAGRGRHAVPRRDRRHAARGADPAAARPAVGRLHRGRRRARPARRRSHHRSDQPGPRAG